MLKARVRNTLGVKAAELELAGIIMVAGRNGAGKSSLLEALACATLGTAAARGMTTKKAQAAVLHEGATAGSTSLDWITGTQRVTWPDGKVESSGGPPPRQLGTPLGIGAVLWSSLDAKARAAEFAQRAGGQPTLGDIATYLEENGGDPADAAGLLERVDVSGWDAVHKTATEAATKKRGAWEQVTKERWGPEKAKGWRPGTLLVDEDYTVEGVQADLAQARAALEKMVAAGAVDQGRIEALRPRAKDLPDHQAREAAVRAQLSEVRQAKTALSVQRQDMLRGSSDLAHACPHCRKGVDVQLDPAGGVVGLTKSPKPTMTADQLADHQRQTREVSAAEAEAQRTIDNLESELMEVVALVKDAADAQRRLEHLEKLAATAPDSDGLARARLLVTTLEERVKAVEAMIAAGEIYRDWDKMQPLIQALSPSGVRAVAARRALESWNGQLLAISGAAGMGEVMLTDDLALQMNGRPFALLSESERWRCDAVMSMALARQEGSSLLLLDRLDVLVADARPGVFKALLPLGLPAVVIGCSVKDRAPETLPHLKKAGIGSVWWMDAGTLTELPY